MKKNSPLNGAWEERGVIGTRIEIDVPHISVLWRNSPVLVTTFREQPTDGGVELKLKHSGLRYENADSDYAELKSLFLKDGKLRMTECFPISGENITSLEKTDRSRYGDFTVVDEVLKELSGEWREDGGFFPLKFHGDTLSVNGSKTKIHVLHSNSGYPPNLRIVDADPSNYDIQMFMSLEYDGKEIIGRVMVFDASPMEFVYKKV